jgi:hypothetical protein
MNGPDVKTISNSTGVVEIPIAEDAVVYTPSIDLRQGEYFAVMYKATSDGNVKLKIEFEQSYTLPETEGAADDSWVETIADINAALADEDWHIAKIEPIASPYGRFKITGLADPLGNDATTTLQLKLGILSTR